ncbi:hypothetical protein OQI_08820 [Streptomyces pharetrae CZA14]|uniref:Uncharacterized protein n=1 Tax=Streptomyces pharetrae CZA14 TaxID=1144883 RepID=A0ABX3YNM7_9ACTN|nr:hypothetical protein OQI_08820 [Streptomyces pharetrae CZA14]
MPRVGSIRSFHGPTGAARRPVWAAGRAAGSVGGCVSCPLSARHDPKKSPGTGHGIPSDPSRPVPEPEKAHSWRTSSPRSSGSRPTRRPGCATRPSSPP